MEHTTKPRPGVTPIYLKRRAAADAAASLADAMGDSLNITNKTSEIDGLCSTFVNNIDIDTPVQQVHTGSTHYTLTPATVTVSQTGRRAARR